jgi:hypothetical protein
VALNTRLPVLMLAARAGERNSTPIALAQGITWQRYIQLIRSASIDWMAEETKGGR